MTGNGTAAQVTLEIDGAPAGCMNLEETFEFFIAFEGLDVGVDGLSPVRAGGDGSFPFTGGLERVVLELTDANETYRGR
jgi:arylsulfatase